MFHVPSHPVPITVAIPVGPNEEAARWLGEALTTLELQTRPPDEVLIIDDMANLDREAYRGNWIRVWRSPWNVGPFDAWNFGVALARNSLVILMAADDWLDAEAVEAAWAAWHRQHHDSLGYYWFSVRYVPEPGVEWTGETEQNLPCNAAMVTKRLWAHTGGFRPECGLGAGDCAFVSQMLYHKGEAGHLYPIRDRAPLYNVRVHPGQATATRGAYQGPILAVRNLLTLDWRQPNWGRYSP